MNHPESLFSTGYLPVELQARLDNFDRSNSTFVGLHDGRLTVNEPEDFVSLAASIASDQTLPLITRVAFLKIAEDFGSVGEAEVDDFFLSWPPIGPLAYGIGLNSQANPKPHASETKLVKQPREIPNLKLRLKLARNLEWGDTQTLLYPSGDPSLHFRGLATSALAIAGNKKLHPIIRDRMLEIVEEINALGDYSDPNLNIKLGPLAIV